MSNQNQNINQEKFDQFVEKLYEMGYGPELEEQETNEDIINMLEKHHLHEQDFDFPEGNWENFKDSVLAGKYDAELEFDDNSSSMKEIIKRYLKGEFSQSYPKQVSLLERMFKLHFIKIKSVIRFRNVIWMSFITSKYTNLTTSFQIHKAETIKTMNIII